MSNEDGPGKIVGTMPDEQEDNGYTPPGQRSYEETEEQRIEAIQDEEQRREEAQESDSVDPSDVDAERSLEEITETDQDKNTNENDSEGGNEVDPGFNEEVIVETDRFGNVENKETVKSFNSPDRGPQNQGNTLNIPGVDPNASAEDRRRQRNAQQAGIRRAEARRIRNNLQREQRFTENRLERLETADPETQIQVGEQKTTVAERRNQLRQTRREINRGLQTTETITDTEIPDAPTVEQTTRQRREDKRREEVIDKLTADRTPAMTGPKEDVDRFDAGTGATFPDVGQQEFAGGTQNINADFREERRANFDQGITRDQTPLEFGVFTGKSVEQGLENVGVSSSQAGFFGEQTAKIGTIGAGAVEGLENLDKAAASFISSPGKSIESARKEFEESVSGIDPEDATEQDVLRGLQADPSRDTFTQAGIARETRRAGALFDTIGLGFGGGQTLRRADSFVLRSPVREVDNPTPDIPGVRQADNRLGLQIPVERRRSTTSQIDRITSNRDPATTSTSDSSVEAFRRELERVSEDDLPDLSDEFRDDAETATVSESREDISGSGDAPRQVGRRRGEEINNPEEGLRQDEIEVLTGRDVGFEDVNPERQTDTGGFERQQVDELQARADRPSEDGLSRFVDEIRDNFGTSKGQLRLTSRSPETRTRIRDVEVDEPDLNRRRDFSDEGRDVDSIDSRKQSSRDRSVSRLEDDLDVENGLREDLSVGLGLGQGQSKVSGIDEAQDVGQGQTQAQDVTEDVDQEIEEDVQDLFDNPLSNDGDSGPGNRFNRIDRSRDTDRLRDSRRRRDRDLPDLENEDDFVFDQGQGSDSVGAELEDQFASSLTAELEGIEAGEDFDPDEFQGTGFDIRPLL